jgi:NADH dehydrogenase (ubiquinone) 1 alpha subcomplex subunit 5
MCYRVSELESKLGAGLIEEVIEVAKGELSLIDVIQKSQAWEQLEEAPLPGQWRYFDRPT